MESNNRNLKNKLEALLFFYNEPVSLKKLVELTATTREAIDSAIESLQSDYKDRGLQIILSQNEVQLVARIDDDELLDKLDTSKQETDFTPAVVETLAVIAYLQSATEAEIDKIRGVKSSRTIRKLMRRGYLDKETQNYRLSTEALRQLGISDTQNLAEGDSMRLKLRSLLEGQND